MSSRTFHKKKSQTPVTPVEFRVMLGARVKSARLARGLSQERLAEQLGLKQAQISRLEAGIGDGSVGARWYPVVAEALRVDVAWLMGAGPDDEAPQEARS